ncbi:hypothetical protein LguiA_012066 [Lonicera macranthoides]
MVTASLSISSSVSPSPILSIFSPNLPFSFNSHSPSSSLSLSKPCSLIPLKCTRILRISATHQELLLAEADLVESNTEQIVSSSEDGVSNIISILLFIAFIGLSILTIGVIYIGVTDYLQKREKEKFEKEEATKKKNGKKRKVKVRAGPRGFGQKVVDEDDIIDI